MQSLQQEGAKLDLVSIRARPIGRAMLRAYKRLFRRGNGASLREPVKARKPWAAKEVQGSWEFISGPMRCARRERAGIAPLLGVRAGQTTKGPSKSVDRKTPYCLMRSSWGSVSR